MENYQFFTLIAMLAGGFGWLIHQMNDLGRRLSAVESRVAVIETRLSIVETILSMMGMPLKPAKYKVEDQS